MVKKIARFMVPVKCGIIALQKGEGLGERLLVER
jgi:hypothetical protein